MRKAEKAELEMPYDGGFKPNRDLLNVNFEGYKLSDKHLHVAARVDLPSPVAVAKLREGEFSYQYMRAHAFHNHLHSDPSDSFSVYWCDTDHLIRKATLDGETISLQTVFQIPTESPKYTANLTLQFLSDGIGILCPGDSSVMVFRREVSNETCEKWTILKSLEASEDKPVLLVTALLGSCIDILCAELNMPSLSSSKTGQGKNPDTDTSTPMASDTDGIKQISDAASSPSATAEEKRRVATHKWIRVKFNTDPTLAKTGQEGLSVEGHEVLGTFGSNSLAPFSTFQFHPLSKEQQLLLISETTPLTCPESEKKADKSAGTSDRIVQDSALFSEPEEHHGLGFEKEDYNWTQSDTDLTISFDLPADVKKGDISCVVEPGELVVGLTDGTTFLQGELLHPIDPELSTWTIQDHL